MTKLEEILKSVDSSVLTTSAGQRKETVYKKDIFADCFSDRDKKTRRRKLRNLFDAYLSSFFTFQKSNLSSKTEKLAIEFDKYYKSVYNINDYSVDSVASKNTDIQKRDNISVMLTTFKSILEKQNKAFQKENKPKK